MSVGPLHSINKQKGFYHAFKGVQWLRICYVKGFAATVWKDQSPKVTHLVLGGTSSTLCADIRMLFGLWMVTKLQVYKEAVLWIALKVRSQISHLIGWHMGNQCTSLSIGVVLAALLCGESVEEKIEYMTVFQSNSSVSDESQ